MEAYISVNLLSVGMLEMGVNKKAGRSQYSAPGPGRSGGVGCRFITRWLAADDLWWSCSVHSRDESSPTEKQILVVMDSNRGARLNCWHLYKLSPFLSFLTKTAVLHSLQGSETASLKLKTSQTNVFICEPIIPFSPFTIYNVRKFDQ